MKKRRKLFGLFLFAMLIIGIPGGNLFPGARAEAASVFLSSTAMKLNVGMRENLGIYGLTEGTKVEWETSNTEVAAVSVYLNAQNVCLITAKKKGTATISATVGKKVYKCKVTVTPAPKLSATKQSVYVGKSFDLKSLIGGSKAVWSVSDKKVLKIKKLSTNKYRVTGLKVGKADVKVKYKGKTYKCTVTVKAAPKLSKTSLSIKDGKPSTLSVSNAIGNVGWSVSDSSILELSASGSRCKITPKNPGKATVSAKVGGKTLKCAVTVKVGKYNMRYQYDAVFLCQPYSGMGMCMYVKTDNPDSSNMGFSIYDTDGKYVTKETIEIEYGDIKYLAKYEGTGFYKVEGGYIITFSVKDPGKYTLLFREYDPDNSDLYAEKRVKKFTVADYDADFAKWRKSIINKATTPGMTKPEQMTAIVMQLCDILTYPENYYKNGGYYWTYRVENTCTPAFKTFEYDSYSYPILLCRFGKDIGYSVKSLYWKYPRGSYEWQIYHWCVQSEEDGTIYGYCPPIDTGTVEGITDVSQIPKIDLSKY